jgi:hypothetical protein
MKVFNYLKVPSLNDLREYDISQAKREGRVDADKDFGAYSGSLALVFHHRISPCQREHQLVEQNYQRCACTR